MVDVFVSAHDQNNSTPCKFTSFSQRHTLFATRLLRQDDYYFKF